MFQIQILTNANFVCTLQWMSEKHRCPRLFAIFSIFASFSIGRQWYPKLSFLSHLHLMCSVDKEAICIHFLVVDVSAQVVIYFGGGHGWRGCIKFLLLLRSKPWVQNINSFPSSIIWPCRAVSAACGVGFPRDEASGPGPSALLALGISEIQTPLRSHHHDNRNQTKRDRFKAGTTDWSAKQIFTKSLHKSHLLQVANITLSCSKNTRLSCFLACESMMDEKTWFFFICPSQLNQCLIFNALSTMI